MSLDTAQIATFKAAMLADSNLTAAISAGDYGLIQSYLLSDSSFVVWRSSTQTKDIYDAIIWAALTPSDLPDSTQVWLNRALACQVKQINLQILIQGVLAIRSDKANIRAGLQDALTNVPSGVSGASTPAGWTAVRLTMQRHATVYEKIFATGTGTQAVPGNLVVEGAIDPYDITKALYQ